MRVICSPEKYPLKYYLLLSCLSIMLCILFYYVDTLIATLGSTGREIDDSSLEVANQSLPTNCMLNCSQSHKI